MTIESVSLVALAVSTFGSAILREMAAQRRDRIANQKIDHIKRVGDDTHTLSNSNMGIQLKATSTALHANYVTMKRLADLTREAADTASADVALGAWVASEKLVSQHEAQQSVVDSLVQHRPQPDQPEKGREP